MDPTKILTEVAHICDRADSTSDAMVPVLEYLLETFSCATGTIHRLDSESGLLQLSSQKGIPEIILDKVKTIPVGKGMAGIAAERMEAVQTCNLQADNSGVVRPGARETKMEGAIAVPMIVDGRLRGTLGVAKPVSYEFTDEEKNVLLEVGKYLGERLGSS